METQSALQRYGQIIKYHGIFRGVRRVIDQILEVDLYDRRNGTNTRVILSGEDFTKYVADGNAAAAMHYQPVYTSAVRKPLQHLVANFPVVGASSACFLDLGCGRGKALHVARAVLQHVSLIGIDLHPKLLADAGENLGFTVSGAEGPGKPGYILDAPKAKLVLKNVNDVPYDIVLAPYDVVIAFNKNSFDRQTTEGTLGKIAAACKGKSAFYVYNNPVFEESFKNYSCVFEMTGWHKNWNTKTFRIS
jgi:SAM-dependent methyltransferase